MTRNIWLGIVCLCICLSGPWQAHAISDHLYERHKLSSLQALISSSSPSSFIETSANSKVSGFPSQDIHDAFQGAFQVVEPAVTPQWADTATQFKLEDNIGTKLAPSATYFSSKKSAGGQSCTIQFAAFSNPPNPDSYCSFPSYNSQNKVEKTFPNPSPADVIATSSSNHDHLKEDNNGPKLSSCDDASYIHPNGHEVMNRDLSSYTQLSSQLSPVLKKLTNEVDVSKYILMPTDVIVEKTATDTCSFSEAANKVYMTTGNNARSLQMASIQNYVPSSPPCQDLRGLVTPSCTSFYTSFDVVSSSAHAQLTDLSRAISLAVSYEQNQPKDSAQFIRTQPITSSHFLLCNGQAKLHYVAALHRASSSSSSSSSLTPSSSEFRFWYDLNDFAYWILMYIYRLPRDQATEKGITLLSATMPSSGSGGVYKTPSFCDATNLPMDHGTSSQYHDYYRLRQFAYYLFCSVVHDQLLPKSPAFSSATSSQSINDVLGIVQEALALAAPYVANPRFCNSNANPQQCKSFNNWYKSKYNHLP